MVNIQMSSLLIDIYDRQSTIPRAARPAYPSYPPYQMVRKRPLGVTLLVTLEILGA